MANIHTGMTHVHMTLPDSGVYTRIPRDSLWARLSNRYRGTKWAPAFLQLVTLPLLARCAQSNSVCVLCTQLSYTWRARALGKDPGQSQTVTRNMLQEMEGTESRTLCIHPCRALGQP